MMPLGFTRNATWLVAGRIRKGPTNTGANWFRRIAEDHCSEPVGATVTAQIAKCEEQCCESQRLPRPYGAQPEVDGCVVGDTAGRSRANPIRHGGGLGLEPGQLYPAVSAARIADTLVDAVVRGRSDAGSIPAASTTGNENAESLARRVRKHSEQRIPPALSLESSGVGELRQDAELLGAVPRAG